jgi:hypothetical protein
MENKQFYRKVNKPIKSEVIEVNYFKGVYSISLISNYNKGESLAMQISHNVEKEFINDLIELTEESNLSEWFAALSIYEASAIKAADISTQLSIKKLTK